MISLAVALALASQRQTFPVFYTAKPAVLRKLVTAARHCGYNKAAVTRMAVSSSKTAQMVIITVPIDPDGQGPYACLDRWQQEHRGLQINTIGNAAPSKK